ncbi:MAG: DUF6431 domain-containing protein [Sporolactobacillus sp.]
MFSIKGTEKVPCPCCGGSLRVVGSRLRKVADLSGEQKTLRLRRLRCQTCGRIHHELPDFVIPYKRYESTCFERVVKPETRLDSPVDDATLFRWNRWFLDSLNYWMGCLRSMNLRYSLDRNPMDWTSTDLSTVLEEIGRLFGDGSGWLGRMAKPMANTNLWIHTRSAFLSV